MKKKKEYKIQCKTKKQNCVKCYEVMDGWMDGWTVYQIIYTVERKKKLNMYKILYT